MAALNLETILALTRNELEALRRRYAALVHDPSPALALLATFLSHREAGTIMALERYCARGEHRQALDVHVRLGGGFPLGDAPPWPAVADLRGLLEVAEYSDAVLEQLRERIELYAAGAELHSALDALVSLSRTRKQQLGAVTHELHALGTRPVAV